MIKRTHIANFAIMQKGCSHVLETAKDVKGGKRDFVNEYGHKVGDDVKGCKQI